MILTRVLQTVQQWQADDNYHNDDDHDPDHEDNDDLDHHDDHDDLDHDDDHDDYHDDDHGTILSRVCPSEQEWRPEICDCDCPRSGERAACR